MLGKFRKPPQYTAGFTLLEVLITMLIMVIGLLGIAAMQLQGLKFNHDAHLRSQISTLASDIADRMRLNSANAADYDVDAIIPVARPACAQATASNTANDLSCWYQQVYDAVGPGANASVDLNAGTGMYTITIGWLDRSVEDVGGNLTTRQDITYTFQP